MPDVQLLWFRQDLRLTDQAAVAAAAAAGPVVALYVLDEETPGDWRIGGAQRWWLHHSLTRLAEGLQRLGVPLLLRRGRAGEVVAEVAAAAGARTVHALHHYEPFAKLQQEEVAKSLDLKLYNGNLLLPPGAVTTGAGARFRIFTPFWKAMSARLAPAAPLPAPTRLTAAEGYPAGDRLDDWQLLPTRPDWSGGFDVWTPGEAGAARELERFDMLRTTTATAATSRAMR